MRRLTVWGLMTFALALVVPAGAQATTCTPNPTSPIVRFATTLGNIDVQLNGADAPCTVQNFESYMSHGAYDGSFIHRSVTAPEVIQGGGFTLSGGQPNPITQKPAIQNEYKDPNIAGSLAMAQSGTSSTTCALDDSATDEWFFNVADNSASLNPQCFTVFGQALDPASTAVINKIAAATVCNLSSQWVSSSWSTQTFIDVPTLGYPAGSCASQGTPPSTATAANLIFVNSLKVLNDTSAPAVTITSPVSHQTFNLGQKITPTYSCNDGTGTGVKSCTGPTSVDTNLYGTLQYTVTATDYAGNSETKKITYVVELPPTVQSLGTVSSKGVLSLKVHCPSSVACLGTVALGAGKPLSLIGTGRFNLRSGATGGVRVPLTAAGWRMLRAAKWRLKVALAITPSGTGSKSFASKVTLRKAKAPAKKKKHHKKAKH